MNEVGQVADRPFSGVARQRAENGVRRSTMRKANEFGWLAGDALVVAYRVLRTDHQAVDRGRIWNINAGLALRAAQSHPFQTQRMAVGGTRYNAQRAGGMCSSTR